MYSSREMIVGRTSRPTVLLLHCVVLLLYTFVRDGVSVPLVPLEICSYQIQVGDGSIHQGSIEFVDEGDLNRRMDDILRPIFKEEYQWARDAILDDARSRGRCGHKFPPTSNPLVAADVSLRASGDSSPLVARWGILGTGRGAKVIAGTLNNARHGVFTLLGSRTQDEETAAEWMLPTSSVVSYNELIESSAVDVVYVGLPTALKFHYALRACNRGTRVVVVDKPFAHASHVSMLQAACAAQNATLADAVAFPHSPAFWDFVGGDGDAAPVDARYTLHLPLTAHRAVTKPHKGMTHRHYSNVRFRMDASLEPMGVVGDLGYYAFLGLLALSKHPHAAARTVQCKAHFADSETDVVVDASGSLSLDGGGAGRRRNAVFSLSYIKPKAEELAIISGDGVSGGGRLAQGLVTGGAELRVVRHAFADNSTSDATFSSSVEEHHAAAHMVEVLSELALRGGSGSGSGGGSAGGGGGGGDDDAIAVRAKNAMAAVDECFSSMTAALLADDGVDADSDDNDDGGWVDADETEANFTGYAQDGAAILNAPVLDRDLMAEFRLGFDAAVALRPSIVYDNSQYPRIKTSLCHWNSAAYIGNRSRCGQSSSSSSSSSLARLAIGMMLSEGILRAVYQTIGAYELASISVDVNGAGSINQHPHFDPMPVEWGEDVHFLFVPLVDLDLFGGPTRVWLGTHTPNGDAKVRHYQIPSDIEDIWHNGGGPLQRAAVTRGVKEHFNALPSKRLLLHAGQAAIMRPITWHAGTANKRAVPRPMLTIIFHKLPADEDEDGGLVGLERGAKEKEGEL